jgi:hypothetical protein
VIGASISCVHTGNWAFTSARAFPATPSETWNWLYDLTVSARLAFCWAGAAEERARRLKRTVVEENFILTLNLGNREDQGDKRRRSMCLIKKNGNRMNGNDRPAVLEEEARKESVGCTERNLFDGAAQKEERHIASLYVAEVHRINQHRNLSAICRPPPNPPLGR